ncbi:MAG: SDR family NAD(P)-dependent oxidoreductase [Clostridia bacterium]|nr:SDR family NAD(P)-dependent oxidoreductase [Clostridia bacterium]
MKIGIITGASSGMGKLFSDKLDKESLDEIWLISRRQDKLEAVSEHYSTKAKIFALDLLLDESYNIIENALLSDEYEISYLINCAGFGEFAECGVTDNASDMKMIDLNVKATVRMCNICIKYMSLGSHLVNLGSASVFNPLPYFNIYASTKSFIRHYSEALSYELKGKGIFVSVFCPGWVDTEFFSHTKNNTAPKSPKKYSPMLDAGKCVDYAMKKIKKRKVLIVYNGYTKLQHLLSKILPYNILCKIWLSMLKDNR